MTGNKSDPINPTHYKSGPTCECGRVIECFVIAESMGTYNLGVAIKYLWRRDLKGTPTQDLRKAIRSIEREIEIREAGAT